MIVPSIMVSSRMLSVGECRSGSTKKRAISVPMSAVASTATTNIARICGHAPIPADCNSGAVAKAPNAPKVRTSPCENLMTFITPKNSVNPMATRPYIVPCINPLSRCWATMSMRVPAQVRKLGRVSMRSTHSSAPGALALPLPIWGEGGGEEVTTPASYRETKAPHPTPLPMGEGAGRVHCTTVTQSHETHFICGGRACACRSRIRCPPTRSICRLARRIWW